MNTFLYLLGAAISVYAGAHYHIRGRNLLTIFWAIVATVNVYLSFQ